MFGKNQAVFVVVEDDYGVGNRAKRRMDAIGAYRPIAKAAFLKECR